ISEGCIIRFTVFTAAILGGFLEGLQRDKKTDGDLRVIGPLNRVQSHNFDLFWIWSRQRHLANSDIAKSRKSPLRKSMFLIRNDHLQSRRCNYYQAAIKEVNLLQQLRIRMRSGLGRDLSGCVRFRGERKNLFSERTEPILDREKNQNERSNQFTGHLPVVRWAWKSAGKSFIALSIGGPGIAIRLQNPLPLLNARILPNCSSIGIPPWPA